MATWTFDVEHVADLATGCALLGSGGGGDTYVLGLLLKALIEERGPVQVIDPQDLEPDATVVNVGFVGAPFVLSEKLCCDVEMTSCIEGMSSRLGRTIDAVMPTEIGGGNGLSACILAAMLGIPVVDGDGMGRAFPQGDQTTYSIHGCSASPTVVGNEHGDVITIESRDNRRIESLVRALAVATGDKCFSAEYVLTAREVSRYAVVGSVTLARRLGAALRIARAARTDALAALDAVLGNFDRPVRRLLDGKVVGCNHEIRGGWGFGSVALESLPPGSPMSLEFQNEFLVVRERGVVRASTPDIISVIDSDGLACIGAERIRYGQRVQLLVIQAPAILTSPEALCFVGPRAFGFDFDYVRGAA